MLREVLFSVGGIQTINNAEIRTKDAQGKAKHKYTTSVVLKQQPSVNNVHTHAHIKCVLAHVIAITNIAPSQWPSFANSTVMQFGMDDKRLKLNGIIIFKFRDEHKLPNKDELKLLKILFPLG